ncbi:MAG: hypothetical protein OEZ22_02820 [Spirochaetia bacterium]|nr:hypothetical protein [Spirochaetia bacterium]
MRKRHVNAFFFLIFIFSVFFSELLYAIDFSSIKSSFEETSRTLKAIYEFTGSLISFFSLLFDWIGFQLLAVAMGTYFCFRFVDGFFPASRIVNIIIGFSIFTILWLTWNQSYYQSLRLDIVLKIYFTLFSYIVVLFIIQKIIVFMYVKMKSIFLKAKKQDFNTIEFYDIIDNSFMSIKRNIREGNKKEALNNLSFLREKIESHEKESIKNEIIS